MDRCFLFIADLRHQSKRLKPKISGTTTHIASSKPVRVLNLLFYLTTGFFYYFAQMSVVASSEPRIWSEIIIRRSPPIWRTKEDAWLSYVHYSLIRPRILREK